MSVVHLIAGGTGAGKTTYAIALAKQVSGVRFSIDEWMTDLFWMDSPQPIDFNWTMERIDRCEGRIREEAARSIALGIAVVLDLGFTKAAHRTRFADWATGIGAIPRLHLLEPGGAVRWARIQQRNQDRGETFRMTVDRAMFDFMEGEWEAPSDIEMAANGGIRVTA